MADMQNITRVFKGLTSAILKQSENNPNQILIEFHMN